LPVHKIVNIYDLKTVFSVNKIFGSPDFCFAVAGTRSCTQYTSSGSGSDQFKLAGMLFFVLAHDLDIIFYSIRVQRDGNVSQSGLSTLRTPDFLMRLMLGMSTVTPVQGSLALSQLVVRV